MPSKICFNLKLFLIRNLIVCTTCTTTDHGRAGHDFAPLNDAGMNTIHIIDLIY
jgi:hypothetical protein